MAMCGDCEMRGRTGTGAHGETSGPNHCSCWYEGRAVGIQEQANLQAPLLIDADHDWALWCEKWRAAMDLVGSMGERAATLELHNQENKDEAIAAHMVIADMRAQVVRLEEALDWISATTQEPDTRDRAEAALAPPEKKA